MNDSLSRWLTNRGFTGTLQDQQKQYLATVATGGLVTDSLQDLWERYAKQNGYQDVETFQKNWAIVNFSTATTAGTWNDAMGNLPA